MDAERESLLRERLDRLLKIGDDPELQKIERELCRRDFFHWCRYWVWTFDPRLASEGKSAHLPLLLFPRQAEMCEFVDARLAAREDGLIEKSRDIGFTWVMAAKAEHKWLFVPGFKTTFGSRVEPLIDKRGEVDSIFEKLRYILRSLPPWLCPTGFNWSEHDNHMRLINPDNGNTIAGEAGEEIGRGGRAQPLDAKVLTPTGWTTMGAVKVGDFVTGGNGLPVRVAAVHPQGQKQIYRVTMSDGSSAECCGDHLWRVTDKLARKVARYVKKSGRKGWAQTHRVLSTSEIASNLKLRRPDGQSEWQYQIPAPPKVHFNQREELPLHPYLVGSLIGDGSISQSAIGFTTTDVAGHYGWSIRTIEKVREGLRALGLLGHLAYSKFIPDAYKQASPEDRLWLLRGLLDTDGWVGKRQGDPKRKNSATKTCFSTVSERLALDVVELVQSLGGLAAITTRPPKRRAFPGDRAYDCALSYQVSIALPDGLNPFHLSRKAKQYKPREHMGFCRSIVSVEPTRVAEAKCITVDAEDGLYVTDGHIVTHNSSMLVVDEAAFLSNGDSVDAATSGNSDVRIWGSSVKGMGNLFAKKRHGGSLRPDQIFTFSWRDDPRKTPEWAEKKRRSLEPHIWASEYELDYSASVEGICIPAKWVKSAMELAKMYPYTPKGNGIAGLDVGAGGSGKSVFIARFGPMILPPIAWGNPDTIETAHRALDEAAKISIPRDKGFFSTVKILTYDSPGVGAGVQSALRHATRHGINTIPVNTGENPSDVEWPDGQTSDQKFANLRAELWWTMRSRFKASHELLMLMTGQEGGQAHPIGDCVLLPPIDSGPDMQALVSQISLPKYHRNDKGKIVIESKKAMRERGLSSPDHADSLALTYLPNPDPLEIWRKIAGRG